MTIRKQLTSTAMFYTPGVFLALQNDYRIKGKTRRRAIQILRDGYGLSAEEARGLLSGSIPVKIDQAAGTVTYESPDEVASLKQPSCPDSQPVIGEPLGQRADIGYDLNDGPEDSPPAASGSALKPRAGR